MNFTRIEIYKENEFAANKPADSELQEILSALNGHNFSERIALPENHCYQEPNLGENDYCHAISRKFASINQNLTQVSGYLVEFYDNHAKLTAHSVLKDINSKNLLEPMHLLYLLDKYVFIEHSTGNRGYDLKAWL